MSGLRPLLRSPSTPYRSSALIQSSWAIPVSAAMAVALLAGCNKKEEAASPTASTPPPVTIEQIGLMAKAPADSFLLVSYDGESEGGKRSYAQSLSAVRGFIKSPSEKGAGSGSEQKTGLVPAAPAERGPRSVKVIQRDLSEILENAGFLPSEPGPTPLYREAIIYAAAASADGLVTGGLCASGPDFQTKLDAVVAAAKARNYDVADHSFGSLKGYTLSVDIIDDLDLENLKSKVNGGNTPGEAENKKAASAEKSSSTDAAAGQKTKRFTLFLGASPEGLIGVSSSPDAVSQCLTPAAAAVPPITTGETIRQLVARHPDSPDDFLKIYFDLDLFKKGLESKRNALEKLLGAPSSTATPCAGEEACKAPTTNTDDIASRLPTIQESINQIGDLPARAILTKGSLSSDGAATFRVTTLLDKQSPQGAEWYKGLEQSSLPRSLEAIPDESAVFLGVHSPLGKLSDLLPMVKDGQYAAISTIRSAAISILGLPAGAFAPELAIVLESTSPGELKKLVKTTLQPLVEQGGIPASSWATKQVEGAPTDYVLTPFGVGVFIGEVSDAVLVSSTETGLTKLVTAHKNGSAEKTAQSLRLASGSRVPFAARVDAGRLAAMARSVQSTLSMLSKDAAAVKSEQIDRIGALGTMYLTLEFADGFTELVWRKVPPVKG